MSKVTTRKSNFEFIEKAGVPLIKCHHCDQIIQRDIWSQMEHLNSCDGCVIPYAEVSGENASKFIDQWVEMMKNK